MNWLVYKYRMYIVECIEFNNLKMLSHTWTMNFNLSGAIRIDILN
jgi:hypothetical protein